MTLQEKAKELVAKYQNIDIEIGGQYDGYLTMNLQDAKQCALVAVDEILKASPSKPIESDNGSYSSDIIESIEYWQEVKTEIEKL
jgi:hypothetical protein